MKRSEVLNLIANQLDFLNGTFNGGKVDFSKDELSRADVILTALEEAGFKPAMYSRVEALKNGQLILNYTDWEPEDE